MKPFKGASLKRGPFVIILSYTKTEVLALGAKPLYILIYIT